MSECRAAAVGRTLIFRAALSTIFFPSTPFQQSYLHVLLSHGSPKPACASPRTGGYGIESKQRFPPRRWQPRSPSSRRPRVAEDTAEAKTSAATMMLAQTPPTAVEVQNTLSRCAIGPLIAGGSQCLTTRATYRGARNRETRRHAFLGVPHLFRWRSGVCRITREAYSHEVSSAGFWHLFQSRTSL